MFAWVTMAAETATSDQRFIQMMVMLGLAVLFFYFILWRPEQKRRQKIEERRKSLKKGDVVIAMGVRATVHEIRDRTIILSNCDGSKIEMLMASITEVEKPVEAVASSESPGA